MSQQPASADPADKAVDSGDPVRAAIGLDSKSELSDLSELLNGPKAANKTTATAARDVKAVPVTGRDLSGVLSDADAEDIAVTNTSGLGSAMSAAIKETGADDGLAAALGVEHSKVEDDRGASASAPSIPAAASPATQTKTSAPSPPAAAAPSPPSKAVSTALPKAIPEPVSPPPNNPPAPLNEKEEVTPLIPVETESVAFEAPTFNDVLGGTVDTVEARADDVTIPQAPKELGAASALFADEAETDAFLPDGPKLETFEPDYPPVAKADDKAESSPSAAPVEAEPVAAGEAESIVFNIPTPTDAEEGDADVDAAKNAGVAPSVPKELGAASSLFADENETEAFLPEGGDLPTFEPDFPPVAPSSDAPKTEKEDPVPPKELGAAQLFADEDKDLFQPEGDDVPTFEPDFPPVAPAAASHDPVPTTAPAESTPAESTLPSDSQPPALEEDKDANTDKHQPSAASPEEPEASTDKAEPTDQSLFAGEAESIAFDIPTGDDVIESAVDPLEAKAEGVAPSAPKELGAASSLFADDNELEAFLPESGGDLQTFEADFPPNSSFATKPKPAEASALFAEDEDVSAFDINLSPSHDDDGPSTPLKPSADSKAGVDTSASALFADEEDSAFDIGVTSPGQEGPSTDRATSDGAVGQPAPSGDSDENLAGNHSIQFMFAADKTHDWFVDTSVDDSLDLGRSDQPLDTPMSHSAIDEPELEYDEDQVPQGWYNDDGEFQWYTEDERRDVRAAMIADGTLAPIAKSASQPERAPREPMSTTVAASEPVANPYEPVKSYEPPKPYSVTSPTGSYFRQQPAQLGAQPASNLVTPGLAQASPYAPPAPANPYAPTAYTPAPAYDPYAPAPAGSGYTPAPAVSGYAPAPATSAPPPAPVEAPKRMKSTAYDPPLRQAKSFHSRPKTPHDAHRAPVAPVVAPIVSEPPSAPPAPPPGPPRRSSKADQSQTFSPPQANQSRSQDFSQTLSPPQSYEALSPPQAKPNFARSQSTPYDTPSNPYDPQPQTSGMTGYGYEANRSMSPPVQPPPRPATASSSHPPKPTSFDPPMRASSRPSSRASRPNFAPAPVTSPFPNSEAPPVPAIPSQFAAPPPKGFAPPPKTEQAAFTPPPQVQQQKQVPPPIVPPPRGPSRGASRSRASSPKYEKFAPPPVPAIPAGLANAPSHPPRTASPPSTSASLGVPPRTRTPNTAPPRVRSPLKQEILPEPTSQHKQAISVHQEQEDTQEFDPEGGAGIWDEGESAFSQAPPVHSTPKGTEWDDTLASTGSPPMGHNAVMAPLVVEDEDDPSKTPVARKVENPYGPGTRHPPLPTNGAANALAAAASSPVLTPRPPQARRQSQTYESESPSTPSASLEDTKPRRHSQQEYNPYGPSSPKKTTPPSPRKSAQPSEYEYNPYGPSSPKKPGKSPSSPQRPAGPPSPKKSSFAAAGFARRTSSEHAAWPSKPHSHQPTGSDPYGATGRPAHERQSSEQQDPYNPYAPAGQTHSRQTSAQGSYNPYAPASPATSPIAYVPSSPVKTHSRQQSSQDLYNPYAPASGQHSREPSAQDPYNPYAPSAPSRQTHSRQTSVQDAYNPYRPSSSPVKSVDAYNAYSTQRQDSYAGDSYNPYAPSNASASPVKSFSNFTSPPIHGGALPGMPTASRTASYDPYAPTSTAGPQNDFYSPGLDRAISPPAPNYFQSMGAMDSTYVPQQVLEQRPVSEDPLGRCAPAAHNIPLAVFGFGGVLITKFPGTADDSPDAPSYGYASHRGLVTIRPVSEVAETSALSTNSVSFPGPLVFDPATAKGAAGDKKRREAVLEYLSSRASEIETGLPYLKSHAGASAKRRDEEAKLVIIRVLTALVEGDGRVFGSPAAQEAIRTALQPPATAHPVPFAGLGERASTRAGATQSQLQQLSSLILTGEKKEAALFAADAGLWSHALVLSSAVGPDLWREIVARFSRAELSSDSSTSGLRSAYSIFGGITPETIDDLFAASNITDDPSADQWREVVAGVLFNSKPTDLVCLDDLGARFARAGLANAGQVCYLLSPNSPFSDMSPASSERPVKLVENARDEDGAIFAEIAEYARSLWPTPKGAEVPHAALPQLVPVKLARAWRAAELGDVEQAKRYCEAIEASARPASKHSRPPHIAPHVAASMEDLLERLTGEPSASPAKGLGVGRGKNKSLGSWIEGRLTKFIAGEDDAGPKPETKPKPGAKLDEGIAVGPFSHFATISPGPSAGVSRAGSSVDVPVGGPEGFTPSHVSHPTTSSYDSGFQPWSASHTNEDEPQSAVPTVDISEADDSEFINPMANMSLGPTPVNDYAPKKGWSAVEDDDDEDLGFGNASLSRGRTPKAPEDDKPAASAAKEEPKKEEAKAVPAGKDQKGWFGGWFGGKKKEDGHNYTRANLGEETSMIYDPDQKRWIVKGAKSAPTPTPTPPPPRAKTASPAAGAGLGGARAAATPPPSSAPPSRLGMGAGAPPPGRASVPPSGPPSSGGPPSGPPSVAGGPPSGPPSTGPRKSVVGATGASLDDLLSRPPSGRPASGAGKKKGRAHGKYVDVFQG